MTNRKRYLLGFGCVLALLVAYYLPWLIGARQFFFKDTTHFFEPLCSFIGSSMASWRLPLWNPYNYCGMSQAAISSPSLFFPLTLFFAVMPFSKALAATMLVSQFACAVGMFLLIMSLGWGVAAAAVAALGVSFSGYMFSLSSNYTLVAAAAWVPFVLVCSRQCARSPGFSLLVANAIAVFMLVSAGRPEISAPGLVLAAATTVLSVSGSAAEKREALLTVVKSVAIGILLSMPVILPSLEWVGISRRSEGLMRSEIFMYSANWYDLVCLFVPEPLGSLQLRNSSFAPLVSTGNLVPYYGSAYVGSLVLALALIGLSRRGGKSYWLSIATLVITVLLALGSNLPVVATLVTYLPGASLLRFPSKLLFFTDLCLALFAARGLYLSMRGDVRLLPHIIFWFAAFIAGWAIFFGKVQVLPFNSIPNHADIALAQAIVVLRAIVQAGIALGAVVLLALVKRRGRPLVAAGVIIAGIVLQLMWNAAYNAGFSAPADYFNRSSFVAERIPGVGNGPNSQRLADLYLEHFTVPPSVDVPDPLMSTINDFQYSRDMLKPFTNMDFHVPCAFGFEGSMVGEYYYYFANMYVASSQAVLRPGVAAGFNDLPLYRLLQTAACKYAVTQIERAGERKPIPLLDSRYFTIVVEDIAHNARIYALHESLPRAFAINRWRSFESRDDLLRYMAGGAESGFDPTKETVVEGIASNDSKELKLTPLAVNEKSPEEVWATVDAPVSMLVVLQDQFYPGWSVTVDNRPARLLRCNGFMQGVIVPPGQHTVMFSFHPFSVFAGLMLMGLGELWCVILLIQHRRERLAAAREAKKS